MLIIGLKEVLVFISCLDQTVPWCEGLAACIEDECIFVWRLRFARFFLRLWCWDVALTSVLYQMKYRCAALVITVKGREISSTILNEILRGSKSIVRIKVRTESPMINKLQFQTLQTLINLERMQAILYCFDYLSISTSPAHYTHPPKWSVCSKFKINIYLCKR
jgi:hypothetical protein